MSAARACRPAGAGAGLRSEPDRPRYRTSETREHGRRRPTSPARARPRISPMQAPFQKDEALLADIAAAQSRGASRLWWLGQSGFLLQSAGVRLLFDRVPVGFSDAEVPAHRQAARPDDRTGRRSGRVTGDQSSPAATPYGSFRSRHPRAVAQRQPGRDLLVARANHQAASERLADVAARIVAIDAGSPCRLAARRSPPWRRRTTRSSSTTVGYCRYLGFVVRVDGLTSITAEIRGCTTDSRPHSRRGGPMSSSADQRQQTRAARSRHWTGARRRGLRTKWARGSPSRITSTCSSSTPSRQKSLKRNAGASDRLTGHYETGKGSTCDQINFQRPTFNFQLDSNLQLPSLQTASTVLGVPA